jgi:hypothetical protein
MSVNRNGPWFVLRRQVAGAEQYACVSAWDTEGEAVAAARGIVVMNPSAEALVVVADRRYFGNVTADCDVVRPRRWGPYPTAEAGGYVRPLRS